ncbi:MAG: NAD(P)H-dependent oxidoreductase [Candidatus Korobacteraceae bacterium]
MPATKVVILDGTGSGDKDLSPILDVLSGVFKSADADVESFPLSEMKLAHCLGCFGCWIKTPGLCVEADAGREIARAIVRSDVTVLFTPVTFGGYSPELKKMLDRFIQLASPFFQVDHGEVHHPPRYRQRPRLMMVGVQRNCDQDEAHIFKTLAGRNAINFHPPSYAAEVVAASDDKEALQRRFEMLLTQSDALPFGDAAASLMPPPVMPGAIVNPLSLQRALLIVGSPKIAELSMSSALGGFLLNCLEKRGWSTESLTLRASLNRPEGEGELLSAVERSGLVLLAFPLYVDALPHLMTKALAVIAAHRRTTCETASQRLVAIANSGFPETHQNSLALAICREFAEQSGFQWAGGLAFGAGGMIGGQPLTQPKRQGAPVKNVIAALEMTANSLAKGLPIPAEVMKLITKNRIPSALWSRLYVWMGARSFKKVALKNGVSAADLLAQPYAAY